MLNDPDTFWVCTTLAGEIWLPPGPLRASAIPACAALVALTALSAESACAACGTFPKVDSLTLSPVTASLAMSEVFTASLAICFDLTEFFGSFRTATAVAAPVTARNRAMVATTLA